MDGKDTSKSLPHGLLAPTLLSHRHIEGIGQLEDLVREEGKEGEKEEVERKVFLVMGHKSPQPTGWSHYQGEETGAL